MAISFVIILGIYNILVSYMFTLPCRSSFIN